MRGSLNRRPQTIPERHDLCRTTTRDCRFTAKTPLLPVDGRASRPQLRRRVFRDVAGAPHSDIRTKPGCARRGEHSVLHRQQHTVLPAQERRRMRLRRPQQYNDRPDIIIDRGGGHFRRILPQGCRHTTRTWARRRSQRAQRHRNRLAQSQRQRLPPPAGALDCARHHALRHRSGHNAESIDPLLRKTGGQRCKLGAKPYNHHPRAPATSRHRGVQGFPALAPLRLNHDPYRRRSDSTPTRGVPSAPTRSAWAAERLLPESSCMASDAA